jgi:hypothetical protein
VVGSQRFQVEFNLIIQIFFFNVSLFSGFNIGGYFNHLMLILAGNYFLASIVGCSNPHRNKTSVHFLELFQLSLEIGKIERWLKS